MRYATTILALILLTVCAAIAQTPDEIGGVASNTAPPATLTLDLETACARLSSGQTVRLSLADGAAITSNFAGWDGERLFLMRDGRRAGFRDEDVLALWMRGRATNTGMIAGAVLGAVGGGAFMGVTAYVIDSMNEGNAPWLPLIIGGMIAGTAGGGLLGAGIGSALPSWELIYARPGADLDVPMQQDHEYHTDKTIGSFSLLAGAARNLGVTTDHSDFAWRLGLLADTNKRFTYGIEMGRYMTGQAHRPFAPWPDPGRSVPVWHAGGVAHLDLLEGPIVPFISAGLAYYNWNDSFLGYNTGFGLRLRLAERAGWIGEYRYHANVQRLTETEPQMATFLAGLSFSW